MSNYPVGLDIHTLLFVLCCGKGGLWRARANALACQSVFAGRLRDKYPLSHSYLNIWPFPASNVIRGQRVELFKLFLITYLCICFFFLCLLFDSVTVVYVFKNSPY